MAQGVSVIEAATPSQQRASAELEPSPSVITDDHLLLHDGEAPEDRDAPGALGEELGDDASPAAGDKRPRTKSKQADGALSSQARRSQRIEASSLSESSNATSGHTPSKSQPSARQAKARSGKGAPRSAGASSSQPQTELAYNPRADVLNEYVTQLHESLEYQWIAGVAWRVIETGFEFCRTSTTPADDLRLRLRSLSTRLGDLTQDSETELVSEIRGVWELLRSKIFIRVDDSDVDEHDDEEVYDGDAGLASAHARDVHSLVLLQGAISHVQSIAKAAPGDSDRGAITYRTEASKLLERWAPLKAEQTTESLRAIPAGHPCFIKAADSLHAVVPFLQDFASDNSVRERLATDTVKSISAICTPCGFPVRFPVPSAVTSIGPAAIHASLRDATLGGDTKAALHLRKLISNTYTYDARRRAGHYKKLFDGEVAGMREYMLLNGRKFEEFLLKGGLAADDLLKLRDDTYEAIIYVLETLLGYPPGTAPNKDSMAMLIGDVLNQMDHFDSNNLYQLILQMSAGQSVRAFPIVDPCIGMDISDVTRQIEQVTQDTIRRRVGEIDGVKVSRYEARQYLGNALVLLRKTRLLQSGVLDCDSPGSPLEPSGYLPAKPGVRPCGDATAQAPQTLHYGPMRAATADWPPAEDDVACRNATATLFAGIAGFEDVIKLILSHPCPPRIVLFSTFAVSGGHPDYLSRKDSSNSTQHRVEAILIRLGLYHALVRCLLIAREQGHAYVPRFSEGIRQAAGRALFALTSADDATAALRAPTLVSFLDGLPAGARAVAAAFPAAFMGTQADCALEQKGLEIINAVLKVQAPQEPNTEEVSDDGSCAGAARAAAARLELYKL